MTPGKVYHVTLTINRPESRAERRHRERMKRLDAVLGGVFIFAAVVVLILITVALCHAA